MALLNKRGDANSTRKKKRRLVCQKQRWILSLPLRIPKA